MYTLQVSFFAVSGAGHWSASVRRSYNEYPNLLHYIHVLPNYSDKSVPNIYNMARQVFIYLTFIPSMQKC